MESTMRHANSILRSRFCGLLTLALVAATTANAQTPPTVVASHASNPIAIVSLDNRNPDTAAKVTGALEVSQGKAIIVASGTVTSGSQTTEVVLPHRGVLRVCASTTVKLAADSSVPADEVPGIMMAMDHGAVGASFATGRNADVLLTPDFRILIGGPGSAEVRIRLGLHGDTCVENAGIDAPYVLVTSVFEGGNYRVQSGQRVMFEHGSLREVVDQEKEPCGCPPAPKGGNEFPIAQSEGLAPTPTPAPGAPGVYGTPAETTGTLAYNAAEHAPQTAAGTEPAVAAKPPASSPANPPTPKKKSGFFGSIGHFFRRVFGAES